jgi:hypothetical protein
LRPEIPQPSYTKVKNVFQLISKICDQMLQNINQDDVAIGALMAQEKNISINFYYTPRVLTNNPLIFDKDLMNKWWEEAYKSATFGPQKTVYVNNQKVKIVNHQI